MNRRMDMYLIVESIENKAKAFINYSKNISDYMLPKSFNDYYLPIS